MFGSTPIGDTGDKTALHCKSGERSHQGQRSDQFAWCMLVDAAAIYPESCILSTPIIVSHPPVGTSSTTARYIILGSKNTTCAGDSAMR